MPSSPAPHPPPTSPLQVVVSQYLGACPKQPVHANDAPVIPQPGSVAYARPVSHGVLPGVVGENAVLALRDLNPYGQGQIATAFGTLQPLQPDSIRLRGFIPASEAARHTSLQPPQSTHHHTTSQASNLVPDVGRAAAYTNPVYGLARHAAPSLFQPTQLSMMVHEVRRLA